MLTAAMQIIWVVNGKEMYQNPAITGVLRSAYFGSFTAMGHKYKDCYVSSHSDKLEPELPIPLVALVATGVRIVSCDSDKFFL